MSSTSREKIALIVFALLIVLGTGGLILYILAGHSWNVAASNIDDSFGNMRDYTAIVYEGTVDPEVEAAASASSASSSKASSASSSSASAATGSGASASAAAKDGVAASTTDAIEAGSGSSADGKQAGEASGFSLGQVISDLLGASDEDEAATAQEGGEASASATAETAQEGTAASEAAQASAASSAESQQAASSRLASNLSSYLSSSTKATVTAAEAKESYEAKDATVFSLDTHNLGAYEDGTVLMKGGHRFGVFSVQKQYSPLELEKRIAWFKELNVDFIVCLTTDKSYVDFAEGLDIVISTQDEGLFVMGETIKGTFYVDAPSIGQVGAILISPSNVVSAKVISEL